MQAFIRKLSSWFHQNHVFRISIISALCIVMIFSSAFLTGIATFRNAVKIIEDGTEAFALVTNEEEAEPILAQAGISVGDDDEVLFSGIENRAGTIVINRAFTVTIEVDGRQIKQPMVRGTVADALDQAGVVLNELDEAEVTAIAPSKFKSMSSVNFSADPLHYLLSSDTTVQITRVNNNVIVETEEIPFETEVRQTDQLRKGVTQVQTEGQVGILTRTTTQVLRNGSVADSTVTEEVTQQPVNQVVLEGTYVPPVVQKAAKGSGYSNFSLPANVTLDGNGIPENYTKVLTGKGVAYTAYAGAKTASGRVAQPGCVAVNPNIIPYGTKMYIVATDGTVYGYAIAADTGGSCMAGTILVDLYMSSLNQCYAWGAKTVNVYILP